MSSKRCLVIAEAGVNHNGDLERALALVDAAAESGADTVKFQTFHADMLVTAEAPKAAYQVQQTGAGQSQAEMLKALELGPAAFRRIVDHCARRRLEFMSTPFDEPSVDFLAQDLGVKRLKVSSGDVTNGPLLLRMARTRLPMVMSTGMSTVTEIREALGVIAYGYLQSDRPSRAAFAESFASTEGQAVLARNVTLLHCTSDYPTAFSDVNLLAMDTIRTAFGLAVGYSDHTLGITVPIAAAARGACVIEKHFTLDRWLPGPDHAASLEPGELGAMVRAIRDITVCLGHSEKAPTASELLTAKVARRSLHAMHEIKAGEAFSSSNISPRRPAGGLSPMSYWDVLGTLAQRDYSANEAIE